MLIKGYVLFLNSKASVLKRLEIIKEKENHKNKIKVYDAVSLAPCNALTTWKQRQSLHLLEPPFFSYSLLSTFSHTLSLSQFQHHPTILLHLLTHSPFVLFYFPSFSFQLILGSSTQRIWYFLFLFPGFLIFFMTRNC